MAIPEKSAPVRLIAWLFFAAWVTAITVLSSIPAADFQAPPFANADKAVHFVLFAAGACPLAAALIQSFRTRWGAAGTAWAIMLGIAVTDEIHQLYTPGRSGADPGDMTADAIGAAFGIACVLLVYGKRPSKADLGTPRPDPAA